MASVFCVGGKEVLQVTVNKTHKPDKKEVEWKGKDVRRKEGK